MPRKRKSTPKTAPKHSEPKKTCFVLMPFGGNFDRYYENVFVLAIEDAGLHPRRADSIFRSSQIMSDVWKFVKEAHLLVADLSGRNPNVFYELGLAHAIGKPVVMVVGSIDDVPFDLRGLRTILYDKEDEAWGDNLRARMVKALQETLEDIPGAVPPMFLEVSKIERPTEDPLRLELRALAEQVQAIRAERPTGSVAPALSTYRIEFENIPDGAVEAVKDKAYALLTRHGVTGLGGLSGPNQLAIHFRGVAPHEFVRNLQVLISNINPKISFRITEWLR